MGSLTTHVLDTANGRPAAGVAVRLARLDERTGGRTELVDVRTNADGRTDVPLLEGEGMTPGVYELVFGLGPYFEEAGAGADAPPFLGEVPVRFGIADPGAHYHVALLASPWTYTTYRGS